MQQRASAVYHIDTAGRIPAGRLTHADDHSDGTVDLFFHPRHVRPELIDQFNGIVGLQVDVGLWRQRWTWNGRMQQPSEGLNLAVSRWRIVSPNRLPRGCHVMPVEGEGSCIWLLRAGSCTEELAGEMNDMLRRIVGDALWYQAWWEYHRVPGRAVAPVPGAGSPALAMRS